MRRETTKDDGSRVVVTRISEELRLAAVVDAIDADASIVPRGAYVADPSGAVSVNPSFEGLDAARAGQLSSYCHFREAVVLPKKPVLERMKLNKAIDFLDSIADDVPTRTSLGCPSHPGRAGRGALAAHAARHPRRVVEPAVRARERTGCAAESAVARLCFLPRAGLA